MLDGSDARQGFIFGVLNRLGIRARISSASALMLALALSLGTLLGCSSEGKGELEASLAALVTADDARGSVTADLTPLFTLSLLSYVDKNVRQIQRPSFPFNRNS